MGQWKLHIAFGYGFGFIFRYCPKDEIWIQLITLEIRIGLREYSNGIWLFNREVLNEK